MSKRTPPVTDDEIQAMFADPLYAGRVISTGDAATYIWHKRRTALGVTGAAGDMPPVRAPHAKTALDRAVGAGLVHHAVGWMAAQRLGSLAEASPRMDQANYYAWAAHVDHQRQQEAARLDREQADRAQVNKAREVLNGRVESVSYDGAGRVTIRLSVEQLDELTAREEHLALLTSG